MTDYMDRLAEMDEQYSEAEAPGFTLHEEGRFVAKIEKAQIEESFKAGDDTLYLRVEMRTDKGKVQQGIQLTNFKSEKQLGFSKGQLLNLGHEGPLSGLAATLDTILDAHVEIDVKHSDYNGETWPQTFFRKIVDTPDGEFVPAGSAAADDDTIPF